MADGWAELHGITVKAANTRAAAPLFRYLTALYFTSGNVEETAAVSLVSDLDAIYNILSSQPMFMSEDA
eukprot:3082648-Pyramimonas_sp.AAC.1